MKKLFRQCFALFLSFLTGFQVIQAEELPNFSLQVQGNGIVEMDDGTTHSELKDGDTYTQFLSAGDTIAFVAKALDDGVVEDVSLNGKTMAGFSAQKEFQSQIQMQNESIEIVVQFSQKDSKVKVAGGGAQASGRSARAGRSGSLRVDKANEILWNNPSLPGYAINAAYYSMSNGAMAFCGEGMKAGVQVGQTVGDPVEQNNANLRKALYYGYKGPGDCLTARYGADGAIGLTSELVSLANCGTCATSAYPALYQWVINNVANQIFGQADPVDVYKVYRCSNNLYGTNWQNQYTKRQDICYGVYSPYGKVKLRKASANPGISADNDYYASLEGCQYGLYSDASATTLVGTLTIGADGQSNTLEKIKAGHYYLKEITPAKGYALDTTVIGIDVVSNQTTTKDVSDQPQANPIEILIKKVDKDMKTNQTQGEASLEGAQFTVQFLNKADKVLRTWVLQTDAQGLAKCNDAYKVSGDDFYYDSQGRVVLPLGKLTIQETKAPKGYKLNKEVIQRTITSQGNQAVVETFQIPTIPNTVKSGRFGIAKFISDAHQSEIVQPEKGAQFIAVLERYYQEAHQDVHAALKLAQEKGTEKEWAVLNTDKNGEATSPDLAYGTYVVKQSKLGENAQETYELKEVFRFVVGDETYGLLENGQRIDCSKDGLVHYYINDIPFTSSVKIVKKDKECGKTISLNSAAFQVQKLDKEGNVVSNYAKKNMKTDANGILSLKVGNQWVHTFITNADNRLSVPGGYLAGSSEAKGSVALPLNLPSGDYRLKEVVAPKGYVLADDGRFTITKSSISGVDEDGQPVLTMVATDVPAKGKLRFKKIWEDGHKGHGQATFMLSAKQDIIDPADGKILYKKGEVIGKYTLGDDDEIVVDNLPMGTGTSAFTWKEVETLENYALNPSELAVDFQQKDQKQTVYEKALQMKNATIKIRTTALNKRSNGKEANAAKKVEVEDVVSYQGLKEKETYRMHAVLVDKKSGQAIKQADGSVVEASKTFQACKSEGLVRIPLSFDASQLGGSDVVVFETLYGNKEHKDCVIAQHQDLNDTNQTISILPSKIHTQAQSEQGHSYQQIRQGKVKILDKVHYQGLVANQTYKLKGVLMDRDTQKVYKEIEATKTFTPKEKRGDVDVEFTLDSDDIKAGKNLVVYETLYEVNADEEIEVASHKDLMDDKQTISFIDLHTSAQSENGNDEQQVTKEKVKWIDAVSYQGLKPGHSYTLKGTLMHKADQKAIESAQVDFVAEQADGQVEVPFEVDLSDFGAGDDFVFFESLQENEKEIAKHQDWEDLHQTIHLIDLQTHAKSEKDNSFVLVSKKVKFEDVVSYQNLEVGKEYTVKGKLMNKETKEPLLIDEKEVVSEKTFVPESKDGQVILEYELDSSDLEGKQTVVFEDLYKESIQVASHADIKDENQTVEFRNFELKINKVDAATKQNICGKDFVFTMFANQTCTDKVEEVHADQKEGTATFKIKEGVYYIKETQAPSGYRLSKDIIKVEVKDHQLYVNDQKVDSDALYTYTMSVSNESEKLGIKTGASNHEMAYVASLILSLCFLFVWHKKTR